MKAVIKSLRIKGFIMAIQNEVRSFPNHLSNSSVSRKFQESNHGNMGFLIDMDGVLYRGKEVIRGASEFIQYLQNLDIPHLFLTNNSKPTPRDISLQLKNRLNVTVPPENIYTSAMATAEFLSSVEDGNSAFVIGEGGLLKALDDFGFAISEIRPDYVVIGEGRTLTIEMVEKAIDFIIAGAKFVVTNLDPSPRIPGWKKPGTAAIASMIKEATGIEPISCGKPSPILMRSARKKIGLRTSQTIIVGDTMETDIYGGLSVGYQTILTLSGNTNIEDLVKYPYRPNTIVNTVQELVHIMEEKHLA